MFSSLVYRETRPEVAHKSLLSKGTSALAPLQQGTQAHAYIRHFRVINSVIKCFPELTPRAWHLATLVQQPGTKDTWLFIGNERQKTTVTRPDQCDHCNLIFLLEGHFQAIHSSQNPIFCHFYDVKRHKTVKASKGKLETSKSASHHFKYQITWVIQLRDMQGVIQNSH